MTHEELKDMAAAYSLDALDDAERQLFEAHLQEGCEQCELLLEEMASVSELLPLTIEPVEPPPELRQALLDQIIQDSNHHQRTEGNSVNQSDINLVADAFERTARNWRRIALVIAAVLVIASAVFAFYVQKMWSEMVEYQSLAAERAAEIEQSQLQLQTRNQLLHILQSDQLQLVTLNGMADSPNAKGYLFIDRSEGRAVFQARNLPLPPADREYQLWILHAKQPASAGVFVPTAEGAVTLPVANIATFADVTGIAVTLENIGGANSPTGDMVLLGTYTGQ